MNAHPVAFAVATQPAQLAVAVVVRSKYPCTPVTPVSAVVEVSWNRKHGQVGLYNRNEGGEDCATEKVPKLPPEAVPLILTRRRGILLKIYCEPTTAQAVPLSPHPME